jgi:hypothetical protein
LFVVCYFFHAKYSVDDLILLQGVLPGYFMHITLHMGNEKLIPYTSDHRSLDECQSLYCHFLGKPDELIRESQELIKK